MHIICFWHTKGCDILSYVKWLKRGHLLTAPSSNELTIPAGDGRQLLVQTNRWRQLVNFLHAQTSIPHTIPWKLTLAYSQGPAIRAQRALTVPAGHRFVHPEDPNPTSGIAAWGTELCARRGTPSPTSGAAHLPGRVPTCPGPSSIGPRTRHARRTSEPPPLLPSAVPGSRLRAQPGGSTVPR